MEGCFICKLSINDGRATVTLREKGARNINEFSKLRNDTKVAKSGDVVHQDCRRDYTNAKSVKQKELDYKTTENRVLRSQEQFNYRDNCLFCGQFADVKDKRKGTDVFPVRTKDFQSNIEKICRERNDEWATHVLTRIVFVHDLHAADAVYHQRCSVNFRTGKSIPSGTPKQSKNKTGRPQHQQAQAAFQKTVEYLLQNEDEQLTVIELVEKMKDYCGDAAYSTVHMKSKIQKYFGDDVIITEINGKPNVITLRKTATSILHDFHQKQNASDPESEKMNIIKAAASLIKSDIKSKIGTKTEYPSVSDVESLECNEHYLPDSLRLFLNSLISTCNHSLKLSAIGQTIIQATRPRSLIAPLQIGLAVQMHHHFGSRFLIDSLYNMGFSSSYSEVQRYEMNAAMSQGTDIPEVTEEGNLQYIADNVDHNLRTIDGHGTFHGMGIIASVTPGFMRTNCIPRTDVNIEELKEIGKIDIRPYKLDKETHTSLKFMKLNQVNATSYSESLSLLSRTVWPIKSTGWSALCQMVYGGVFPGKSSIVYLPMIDMNPSDLTCINSTLHFISKEARRHNADPVVTFDQPLYWKAVNIILNEAESSTLKSMVVRLGGFHTEMSFLGSIGHIMNSSGLSELLETVYASTAVGHMLSGKAISRAVRGHFLTQTALTLLITSEIYDFPQYTPGTDTDDPSQSYLDDKENFPKADTTCVDNEKPSESNQILPSEIEQLITVFEGIIQSNISIESLNDNPTLNIISERISLFRKSLKNCRTASLWFQYMDMVELLRQFITAERTGNWNLHLKSLQQMLPYLAASGHNLYAKSVHIYLQQMQNLPATHPALDNLFKTGHHVIRRTDRFWAGLSTDLVIEQALMRSLKTTGGLTRGRGLSESQRLLWLLSMPQCSQMNEAMQKLTDVNYNTSEQHKELGKSRIDQDKKDVQIFKSFLGERNPFSSDINLRNIETGTLADEKVNVERSVDIGKEILKSMEDQYADDFVFKKNKQVVTLASKTNIKIDGEEVVVDPQLLFQRLVAAANNIFPDISEVFKFELSSTPAALFEPSGLMRQAQKATLGDALWNIGDCAVNRKLDSELHYVIDGGSLIQRLPWNKGSTFGEICQQYVDYIKRRYDHAVIVFDGYTSGPSTKDHVHMRRTKGVEGAKIIFKTTTPFRSKKENFLTNNENKQNFINMLSDALVKNDFQTEHADADADVLIAKTDLIRAIENSVRTKFGIFKKLSCCWDQKLANYFRSYTQLQDVTRPQDCMVLEKVPYSKKMSENEELRQLALPFLSRCTSVKDIVNCGVQIIAYLYGGVPHESLDIIRYRKFANKVLSNSVTFLQVQTLPPTSAAAEQHCKRVFYQIIEWTEETNLNPLDWGWSITNDRLTPIKTTLPAAPDKLLNIIRCKCKTNCDTRRCTCRKHGLECTIACSECKGHLCTNAEKIVFEEDQNE
ncbi:unnamed protein product [Mytilus edulis]|uniref:Tesmin/TSO1-like CXC domain-containing protein n=1 Tax=Mytilus edulis TaxID=6550 RepID=A0A8S3UDB8_MYTED|nr:unnamed protein product [Mytilus edulis]